MNIVIDNVSLPFQFKLILPVLYITLLLEMVCKGFIVRSDCFEEADLANLFRTEHFESA